METAIQLIQLYEANYPELLYRVFVVNGLEKLKFLWTNRFKVNIIYFYSTESV